MLEIRPMLDEHLHRKPLEIKDIWPNFSNIPLNSQ